MLGWWMWFGCAGRDVSPPSAVESEGCVDAHVLTAYDGLAEVGRRYRVTLRRTDAGWEPTQRLEMPRHHASSIRWDRVERLREVAVGQERCACVTALGRLSLVLDPTSGVWRASYAAQVSAGCASVR